MIQKQDGIYIQKLVFFHVDEKSHEKSGKEEENIVILGSWINYLWDGKASNGETRNDIRLEEVEIIVRAPL